MAPAGTDLVSYLAITLPTSTLSWRLPAFDSSGCIWRPTAMATARADLVEYLAVALPASTLSWRLPAFGSGGEGGSAGSHLG